MASLAAVNVRAAQRLHIWPCADVANDPPRNGRLLPVKRADACTAEVRGSNPLSSTRKSAQIDLISYGTG